MTCEVTFPAADSVKVYGTLCEAEHQHTFAILLHGITTDRNEYLDFYRAVTERIFRRGVSSLRFDFRGHGKSQEEQSAFSPIGQVLDLIGAINFLAASKKADNCKLIAFGTSFGAGPALFVSRLLPNIFAGIYLLAPVLDYRVTFLEPKTAWAKEYFSAEALANSLKYGSLKLDEFNVGIRAITEMAFLNPSSVAQAIRDIPIRIVHGEEDSMVPIEQSENLQASAKNVSLLKIPGMDHGYNAIGDEDGRSVESARNLTTIVDDFLAFTVTSNG